MRLCTRLRGGDGAIQEGSIGYRFSPGFRSAVIGDQRYEFTKKQAEVVEILFDAVRAGLRKVHQDEIKGLVNTNQRVGQLFRDHPAYGTLIQGDDQAFYWLNL